MTLDLAKGIFAYFGSVANWPYSWTEYKKGNYELAAGRIREAGRLGLRDRRLGALLTLAPVKAGQRLLFDVNIKGVK